MDRKAFGVKTFNSQRPRVDRFVAPRASFAELRRRTLSTWSWEPPNTDYWYTKYIKQRQYINYLDDALQLEPLKRYDDKESTKKESWPCVPRKRRYLSSADSILDLPTYSYATFPELLDWSNDNILVAALGRNYHKWSWRSQKLISQGQAQYDIHCCKFDPRSELLILGTHYKSVEIHDSTTNRWLRSSCCRCRLLVNSYCSITTLDWSPTGNSFVTGCSMGMVTSFTRCTRIISWKEMMCGPVLIVKVSPDARYVVLATLNADTVYVLSWPSLEMITNVASDWTITTLAWHPWRSALLGIGAINSDLRATIAMWDAPSEKVCEANIGHDQYSLDAMLFSDRTGELVISLWNSDTSSRQPKPCSHLLVLGDAHTVVDHWGEGTSGLDRIRTMIFSPDGTKLATATADEDLIIWNFLPEDKKRTRCKRFCLMPVYLDTAMHGFSVR
ncbi:protein cortex-like [Galleria mellonella]|uniref:Protein cortex-like n=1 Tax=Galleria mellonella TaxID=7137 RepID=A0ABM3N735_GALME|nr:protein cortex-like [Galleria mellonella]